MRYCSSCGYELASETAYCAECGNKLEQEPVRKSRKMQRQGSHRAIASRDIAVVRKYFGALVVSLVLKVLAGITLVGGITVGAIVLASTSNFLNDTFGIGWGFSSTDKAIYFVSMVFLALVASMLLLACSYIVQILVDTEKNTRRQLKLLWMQNKYYQDEYQEEEEDV